MTYAEYLAAEALADVRHEFLDGDVWAMSGGTPEHAALAAAIIQALGSGIRNKPCRVFTSDLRIHVEETGLSTYPDVAVVCGRAATAPADPHAVINPTVLVEVLSDSTEAYDRGVKFAHYRISSLQAYLLVSQTEPRLEVYRRTDAGLWLLSEARRGETIEVAPLAVHLDVTAIYTNPLTE
jgi:Uma2 family endonuclease